MYKINSYINIILKFELLDNRQIIAINKTLPKCEIYEYFNQY